MYLVGHLHYGFEQKSFYDISMGMLYDRVKCGNIKLKNCLRKKVDIIREGVIDLGALRCLCRQYSFFVYFYSDIFN